MMHSDYFALSACATSILFLPFMIIAQLRFAHLMALSGYNNAKYFSFIKSGLGVFVIPLAGICIMAALSQAVLSAYLYNTWFYEMQMIIGYLVLLMILAAAMAFVFQRYVMSIKVESDNLPIKCDRAFVEIYFKSVVFLCAVVIAQNLIAELHWIFIVTPMLTPFCIPLSNLAFRREYKKTLQNY